MNQLLTEVLANICEGVCHPLKIRVEKILNLTTLPVSTIYAITSLIRYYKKCILKVIIIITFILFHFVLESKPLLFWVFHCLLFCLVGNSRRSSWNNTEWTARQIGTGLPAVFTVTSEQCTSEGGDTSKGSISNSCGHAFALCFEGHAVHS